MRNKRNKRIIRKLEMREKTGLSDTTWWRLEQKGKAPKRVNITEKLVGWYEDEVDEWLSNPTGWSA